MLRVVFFDAKKMWLSCYTKELCCTPTALFFYACHVSLCSLFVMSNNVDGSKISAGLDVGRIHCIDPSFNG
jgi:hypothetical protein